MNKLPDIAPTAGDLATAHARRIQISVNRMISVVGASYIDHPAAAPKSAKLKTGEQVQIAALPAVPLADIQTRLGASRAVVDAIMAALNATPKPPSA